MADDFRVSVLYRLSIGFLLADFEEDVNRTEQAGGTFLGLELIESGVGDGELDGVYSMAEGFGEVPSEGSP